ncbi:MAG: 2-C-methyl-D-erythritol 2,4-cyclodiphosphate synthase [Saccharofermentanales bacterium]|jgi:2-C-methyl-D-erythritol 2,4-cyclodiphosphate synthase
MIPIAAVGQDSHRFSDGNERPLMLGGIEVDGAPGLAGNSDADVVLHALTNAISGLTGERILGRVADRLCEQGTTDSRAYVKLAMTTLEHIQLTHASFSIEARRPHLADWIDPMRESIAELLRLPVARVAITATSGEGLTSFGRGEGIACVCIVSALVPDTFGLV